MPASRSRTTEWRRSLSQVFERGGCLELSVSRPEDEGAVGEARGGDLVWRVKMLDLAPDHVAVEAPQTLGRSVLMTPGLDLMAAVVIGQNRWMFRTRVLSSRPSRDPRRSGTLALQLPDHVERCQRRHGRFDARALNLPQAEVWPLLDPRSVVAAERANELAVESFRTTGRASATDQESLLPTVGPRFGGTLLNLGGGGVGIRVAPAESGVFNHHRVFWLRIPLGPEMPVPVCVTGKAVHTHLDSSQMTYAGMAFDFSFNPGHLATVAEQIGSYVDALQARQRLRAA